MGEAVIENIKQKQQEGMENMERCSEFGGKWSVGGGQALHAHAVHTRVEQIHQCHRYPTEKLIYLHIL